MRFIRMLVGQILSAAVMGLWIALMAFMAAWMVRKGWWMIGHEWVFTGAALAALGVLWLGVCLRGAWLVLMVLAGRTSGRLARRDFRNSVANMLMFARAGVWKD